MNIISWTIYHMQLSDRLESIFEGGSELPQESWEPMLDELKAVDMPGLRPIFKVFVELRLRP